MYTYAEEKGDEGERVEYVGHYFLQLKYLLCRMNNNTSWRGEDEDARPVVMADRTFSSARKLGKLELRLTCGPTSTAHNLKVSIEVRI